MGFVGLIGFYEFLQVFIGLVGFRVFLKLSFMVSFLLSQALGIFLGGSCAEDLQYAFGLRACLGLRAQGSGLLRARLRAFCSRKSLVGLKASS